MLDAVDAAAKAWGRAMRWIQHPRVEWVKGIPEARDTDFPSMDTVQRAKAGGLGDKVGPRGQRYHEVMTKDALAISLALRRRPLMPEEQYAVFYAHYVQPEPVKAKLEALSRYLLENGVIGERLSLNEYWRNMDRAHWFLAGRLESTQAPTLHVEQVLAQVGTK